MLRLTAGHCLEAVQKCVEGGLQLCLSAQSEAEENIDRAVAGVVGKERGCGLFGLLVAVSIEEMIDLLLCELRLLGDGGEGESKKNGGCGRETKLLLWPTSLALTITLSCKKRPRLAQGPTAVEVGRTQKVRLPPSWMRRGVAWPVAFPKLPSGRLTSTLVRLGWLKKLKISKRNWKEMDSWIGVFFNKAVSPLLEARGTEGTIPFVSFRTKSGAWGSLPR